MPSPSQSRPHRPSGATPPSVDTGARGQQSRAERRRLASVPDSAVPDTDAAAAAARVVRFLDERSQVSLLDPDEVTAVFVPQGMLTLERADLLALCQFVGAHVDDDVLA